jgi:hypothetical protein
MQATQIPLIQNVTYVLHDRNGQVKQLWTDNSLGAALLKLIRSIAPASSSLALNGLRIPLLTGFWSNERNIRNLVVSAGKAGVASRINGSGGEAAFTFIAVGTGTNAAAAGDTTLQAESSTSGLSRAAATASRVTTSVTNDTAQLVLTYTVTGTVAVTESGVLNAASVGTLLARQVFSAINVVNGDSLQITWKFQAS